MPPIITVVDPWHWLTEDGALPEEPRLRNRTLRVAQFIEAGGPIPRGHTRETLVPCRRRPAGKGCTGLMWVLKEEDDALQAFCPTCRTAEFQIHNWKDTLWAEGPMEPVPLDTLLESERDADEPKVEQEDERSEEEGNGVHPVDRVDEGDPLSRVLAQMRSPLSAATVRARIATA